MHKDEILKRAEELEDEIIGYRRAVHSFAETGFQTDKTKAFVFKALKEMGIEGKECGKGGLTATIGKNRGKTILLRADMDALPIKEEAGIPFKAQNGNMHACGHDMHTAMLLGAAKILKEKEGELSGRVKLMFQSAEEILEGAEDMIKNGVLLDPPVDAGLMIHVNTLEFSKQNCILISKGGIDAPAAAYFRIEIKGKGCHGAEPQNGVDAALIGAHIIVSLEAIPARELSMLNSGVITIGKANTFGAANAIADKMLLEGTVRTFDINVLKKILCRIREISENTASAFRGEAHFEVTSGCPPLKNDKELSLFLADTCKELLGEESVAFSEGKGTASEDFSFISQEIPAVALSIAAGNGKAYPLHHPKVEFEEKALPIGSAVFSYSAIKWLEKNT